MSYFFLYVLGFIGTLLFCDWMLKKEIQVNPAIKYSFIRVGVTSLIWPLFWPIYILTVIWRIVRSIKITVVKEDE